jgi:hypothetical protein
MRLLPEAAPGLTRPQALRSSGHEVAVTAAADDDDLVARTVAAIGEVAGDGIVGVITAAALRARLVSGLDAAGVAWAPELRPAAAPVVVLTPDEAKGLEFDAVIVVEPAAVLEGSEHGLRSLFVALTRCTNRLVLVHARPLPSVLGLGDEHDDDSAPRLDDTAAMPIVWLDDEQDAAPADASVTAPVGLSGDAPNAAAADDDATEDDGAAGDDEAAPDEVGADLRAELAAAESAAENEAEDEADVESADEAEAEADTEPADEEDADDLGGADEDEAEAESAVEDEPTIASVIGPAVEGPAVEPAATVPDDRPTIPDTATRDDAVASTVALLGDLDHDIARAVAAAVAEKLALLVAPTLLPLVAEELVRAFGGRSPAAVPVTNGSETANGPRLANGRAPAALDPPANGVHAP